MIRLVLPLLLAFSMAEGREPEVRVRLLKGTSEINLKGDNLSVLIESKKGTGETIHFSESLRFQSKTHGILLSSRSTTQRTVASRLLTVTAKAVQVNGVTLARTSRLEIRPNASSGMDLIARVPLEQYLLGVLPSEMPASWPLEALKAQAIASRSYVLRQMMVRRLEAFDVDVTIYDQVFKPGLLGTLGRLQGRIVESIKSTEEKVLYEKSGQVLRAYFHSDCGGSTEGSFPVWRTHEPMEPVKDQFCPKGPNSSWTYELSVHDLERRLSLTSVRDLRLALPTPSGRVGTVIVFSKGLEPEAFMAEKFRRLVGFNQIKSTFFSVQRKADRFVFSGKGHGHGVGLCQWGSRALAERGRSFQDILSHYYPQAKVDVMNESSAYAEVGTRQ